jgi:transglutaminase/protease-like cytokinesis protein 3
MKKIIIAALTVCLLLSGCSSWMDGHYASIKPHMEQNQQTGDGITAVSNTQQIRQALINMIENAVETRAISVEDMASEAVEKNMQRAIQYILVNHPLAAYAVEDIVYEVGITGGVPAVVVTVKYNHNRMEIQRIRQVQGMEKAVGLIYAALDELEQGVVLQVSDYVATDYAQLVENYALQSPNEVMEIPQVTVNVYPDSGLVRVVELKFVYQNTRESLRQMQRYVQPRFTSATLYVSGEEEQSVKFSRLYAFLMETTTYTIETSITPAYSLLRHSVGDSKAFATVYAAMCRAAGLDCQVVTGTKSGEPWFWNIICEDGVYYHVDLLRSSAVGQYLKLNDAQMEGYVWDYDAYPVCEVIEETDGGTE